MTYEEMASDAGYRGEEAAQVAAALEAQDRAEAERAWAAEQEAFAQVEIEEKRMSEKLSEEISEYAAKFSGDGQEADFFSILAAKALALEAGLEAIRVAAIQLEDDLDGTAFLDSDRNDAYDLASAQSLWAAAQEEQREWK